MALGAAAVPLLIGAPAWAQEAVTSTAAAQDSLPPPDPASLTADQRIALLEAQLSALQAQIEDLKTQAASGIAAVRSDQQATTLTLKNGRPTFATGDGQFTASIRGVMQLDTAQYFQDDNLPASVTTGRDLNSGTNFRRGRLGVEGRLFGDFSYNVLLDFGGSGTDGSTTLHELWLQYEGFKPFKLRVGAFPPNLGLEDAASTSGSLFPERPSSAEIARSLAGADKRIGAQLLANGDRWLVAAAVTGAKTTDAATFDEQLGYTFRVAGTPLKGYDWRIQVGANASVVAQPAQTALLGAYPVTLTDRPELRVDGTQLVSSGAIDASGARHWGLEAAGQWKGLLIQGEYFDYKIDRRNPAPGVHDPAFDGWYVEGGWVLTGETRKFNPETAAFDAPPVTKPFNLKEGTWGTWELAARYSVVDLNSDPFAALAANRVRGGEQTITTLGVNWFLNPSVRLSLDWLDVSVDRLTAGGLQAGQDYQALNLRSQFAF
ncbi:phosphate-selective porin OprO/OprP [Caulobacter ginsengisoli]|uniref:Phosphate-selective porin OprO/OprP n=1 Tax=Caulobacter ginsengisoli TaxID=400775 RepID=A0ABU0IWU3_9CAUL|nr:porin [Caulobacter ginsengisoli]MDQ0466474.1 phosphate-selective porin OprO/OprP [Caulobacter ginsengisoli]